MPAEIIFIIVLRSIAALIALALAIRDGDGFVPSLRSCIIGFIIGLVGLIARARMDRRVVQYAHILQDALLNLGVEAIALYGIPHFLK